MNHVVAPERTHPPSQIGDRRKPLRFGILYDDTAIPQWVADCLRHLLATPYTEVALLIARASSPEPRVSGPRVAQPSPSASLLWRLYSSSYLARRKSASKPMDLSVLFANVDVLHWESMQLRRHEDAIIERVRGYNLDFILHCGNGVPRGELPRVPRYGVWAFYHGNQGQNRQAPPCFWEAYHNAATIQAALLKLGDDGGPSAVLRQGTFKNLGYSYRRTRDQVGAGAAHWPAQVCMDIWAGKAPYLNATSSIRLGRRELTNARVARLLVMQAWRFLILACHRLSRDEEWNIGIIDAPIHTFLSPGARPAVRWLPEPAHGAFLADPFGVETETVGIILIEQFDQRAGRGHISVLESRDDGTFSRPQRVIGAPYHLSYPYILQHQGAIYCIPESGATGEVTLYKALAFPHQWAKHATLISGFAAKDATLFQHDHLWWLFCSAARHAQNNTLYAWYASDPHGPWIPHPANPLKVDIRSSRPAGAPFIHAGRLYRPAQDCSRTYGGAVTINHVVRLTPAEFEEEPVASVDPYRDGPYPLGLHTLSAFGQRTIIDGKRERWSGRRISSMARRVLPPW